MKRRGVSIAVGAALLLGIVGAAGSTASAGNGNSKHHDPDELAGVGTVEWGPCDDAFLDSVGAECGMLSVPLDYSRPRGTKIQLALSRVQHDPAVEYQGIMLVNPGGPGGSGLIYSVLS